MKNSAITFSNNTVELTEMEAAVVAQLNTCDEYDERHYAHIDDLCATTKIEMSQLRGVVSSLTQKDVLYVDKNFFRKGDSIVFMFKHQN